MKKETEEDGWRSFMERCLKAKDVNQLDDYLHLFLTAAERQEIAGRYLIIRELLKNETPQREISRDLGVSIAKISRGSNLLKELNPDLKKFLK